MRIRLTVLLSSSVVFPAAIAAAQEVAPAPSAVAQPPAPSAAPVAPTVAPEVAPATPVAPVATVEATPPAAAPEPAPLADPYGMPAPEAPPTELPSAEPAGPEFLPLKVGGSFWSRYEMRKGYADHGLTHPRLHREGDYIVSRARLSLQTNPVDVGDGTKVSAMFVPQAAFTMQEPGTPPPPVTIGDAPPLAIYEAFARVESPKYQFDVGRFEMDYGDALVIGNLGWNENGRGFQGARLHLTPQENAFYVDGFMTLLNDGRRDSKEAFSGDTYFYGVYAGLGPLVNASMALDVYLLGRTVVAASDQGDNAAGDPIPDVDGATLMTFGARVKETVDVFDYRAEAGVQFGTDVLAYQADAELGVTPAKGFRVGLEGLVASGDDPDTDDKFEGWNELYPTGHKFLGLADIVGVRSNVASGNLNLSYAVNPDWILKAQGHVFSRLQVTGGAKKYQGTEIDTHIIHPIGKGASVRAMYALFVPNEDFGWAGDADASGDPLHYLEVQFGYDFK